MTILDRPLTDALLLQPKVFEDQRGTFIEAYKERQFQELVSGVFFVQDNESKSSYGVLRGLHFQKPPFEQTKLVRVIQGEVLDVAVDLRKDSETYGKWESIILSGENKKQFLVPKGFAHGFIVISDTAIFSYKVDNIYAPDYDSGIIYNDQDLNIDWRLSKDDIIISEKDKSLSNFKSLIN